MKGLLVMEACNSYAVHVQHVSQMIRLMHLHDVCPWSASWGAARGNLKAAALFVQDRNLEIDWMPAYLSD